MRETRSKVIKGRTYKVRQLPGRAGLRTLARLTRMLGPVGAGAGDIVPAIIEALRKLDLDDVVALAEELAFEAKITMPVKTSAASSVDIDLDLDEHFGGDPGAMLEWIAFALEVNFADFFGDLSQALGGALGKAASLFRSTSESAGSPSASPPADGFETL